MALNIKPEETREHEIANLVYWNIPWIQGLSVLLLLIAVQHTVLHFDKVTSVARGVLLLVAAYQLVTLFRREKKYVSTEKEPDLDGTLAALGNFWRTYSYALVFSAASVLNLSLQAGITYTATIFLVGGLLWFFYTEKKPVAEGAELTRCISRYAIHNLKRVRFVAFFSLFLGFTFLVLYILGFFLNLPLSEYNCLLLSISYTGIGTAAGLYWRKVRDIHRNPSVIYFERSLERLNLYWILFAVFSTVQFIAGFL